MVRNGDRVIISKPEWNLFEVEMEVVEAVPTDEFQIAYFGQDHIIVKDKHGNLLAVKEGDYRLVEDEEATIVKENVKPKLTGLIIPNKRDRGTQRLFYSIVETHSNGVSFYDDLDNRRTYGYDKITLVDKDNCFDYLVDLSNQVYELRRLITNTFDLIKNDIENSLHSYEHKQY